jgi:hypothetical protein
MNCKTCRHWDQRFPQNIGLGVCQRVGILVSDLPGEPIYAALSSSDLSPPVQATVPGDQPVELRTRLDFGCIFWGESPKFSPRR